MSLFVLFFYALVFALVGLLSYWALSRLMPSAMNQRMASLKAPMGSPMGASGPMPSALWQAWQHKIQKVLDWLSPLSMDGESEDPNAPSRLRLRFFNAGVHARSAPAAYLAAKTALTFLLPGLAALWF